MRHAAVTTLALLTATASAAPEPRVVAKLARGCPDDCAWSIVTVFDDGRVTFVGGHDRRHSSKGTGHVTTAQLDALARAFTAADFANLRDECPAVATDGPGISVFHDDGKRKKTVVHELGCTAEAAGGQAKLDALVHLEEAIDAIAGTDNFLGAE